MFVDDYIIHVDVSFRQQHNSQFVDAYLIHANVTTYVLLYSQG